MKVLITGFSGFVSRHFVSFLEENKIKAQVLGVGRSAPTFAFDRFEYAQCAFKQLDLLDKQGVDEVIYGFQPTHVVHLAAYSSVGFSWQKPVDSFANNTNVLLNLLEQIRSLNLRCRVLSVGSSEEYGDVTQDMLPLHEDATLRPVSPYAVARVAQEMLSRVYVRGYGLDIVMTRSFNHIGPFQRDVFVVPSLAKQLTEIRYGNAPPHIKTGDREIVRDFIDVRDVVRAYYALLMHGDSGEVYNVCSGSGTSIQGVIDIMQGILGTAVELSTDPRLVRPSDNRMVVGSNDKISQALGWRPLITLEESLGSVLAWWRSREASR